MGQLLIPRRFYSQPAEYFRLASWLPPGSMVWIGTTPTHMVAPNTETTLVGVTGGVGQPGIGVHVPAGTGNFRVSTNMAVRDLFTPTAGTIAVFRQCLDTTNRRGNIAGYDAGLANRLLMLAPNTDGILYFDWGIDTNRVSVAFGKTTAPETLVFSNGSVHGQRVYRNASVIASGIQRSHTWGTQIFNIGSGHPNNATDNQLIFLCVTSPAEWSEALVRRWSANPWSIAEASE